MWELRPGKTLSVEALHLSSSECLSLHNNGVTVQLLNRQTDNGVTQGKISHSYNPQQWGNTGEDKSLNRVIQGKIIHSYWTDNPQKDWLITSKLNLSWPSLSHYSYCKQRHGKQFYVDLISNTQVIHRWEHQQLTIWTDLCISLRVMR